MAPVRTRYVALVSTRIPNFPQRKKKGGGSGGGVTLGDVLLTPTVAEILEGSGQGTPIVTLESVPTGATFELTTDAGGRFEIINGNEVVAGAVPTDYEAAPEHAIMVRAVLGASAFDKPILVHVLDVDELQSISLSGSLTVFENTAAGVTIGGLSSVPPGAVLSLVDNAGNRFALSGSNIVTGAVPTNYEAFSSHTITVEGVLNGETLSQDFTITVLDVDEISDIILSNSTIVENSAAGVVVGALSSFPTGATFTLTDNAGNRFAISGNNLVAGPVPTDYDTQTSHQVTVRGTRLGETYDETFTVNVSNVNELSNITLSNASINENSAAGVVVGALASVLPGATFSMVDAAGSRFAISGNNLVAGSVPTNFEGASTHDVTIRATRGADTYDKSFTITVNDVDEINDIALAANSIAEGSAAGTVVGALTSTPTGAAFSLTDNAGGRFAISGTNLVAGSTPTDYESFTSHQVTVRGTRLGETYDETFTVNVTDVAEVTDIALSNNSLFENSGAGTVVGGLSSTPSGATFSLAPGNTAGTYFAVSGTDLVAGATPTNYEGQSSFSVMIRATLNGVSYDESFTVNISDEDEINDISLSGSSLQEGSGAGTFVGTLSSSPGGASFSLQDSASGRFALSGNNVVAGSTPTDYESQTSHSITVRGTRQGEIYDESFTIFVSDNPADNAPVYELTSSISNGNLSVVGSAGTPPVTASVNMTALGKTDPTSYAWSRVSGNSQIVSNTPSAQTTTYTLSGGAKGNVYTAVYECIATDSLGKKGRATHNVTITWN